ncbi:Ferric/cupric reductase transmembrane component [Lachnellula subtilissima]|uniref:ferric-chelate reductase (NADPH) n=1 Tax=Lachnellula subtilissima TaxID=602034 RepID=A0A8H8UFH4_9HELO|nr:Ferric/cupric reductase transmembrane component [Lachnellula subtilissima]
MDMPGMVMPSSAATGTDSSPGALSTVGLDMTNSTVQAGFLSSLLYDTNLLVTSNAYAAYFWYGIVVVIALSTLLYLKQMVSSYLRIRAASANKTPSVEATSLRRRIPSVTAGLRKIFYVQFSAPHSAVLLHLPPLGVIVLLLAYLAFVLALEYTNQDTPGEQHREAIAIRAGWLTVSQLPLLILLAGKNNIIGLFTGVTYERLNVFHRWVARIMLLTATLHFGYQQALWASLNLATLEWDTDTCPPTGIQAYAFLIWMNISTLAPIRHWWYELFVIQHILTFFGFIISLMLHLPSTALYSRVYAWIPIGLYILDRLIRTLRYIYNNIRPGRATLIEVKGGATKIVVSTRQIKHWTPGSFVLLSIPRFGIGQSHPATIASTPSSHSGELVFILQARNGFTSRIHAAATEQSSASKKHLALIDGPYGGKHLDFASFSTVILIAGASGVTFTLPLLLDIASRVQKQTLPVRNVHFIWAIKEESSVRFLTSELQQAADMLHQSNIELTVRICITGGGTLEVENISELEAKIAAGGQIETAAQPIVESDVEKATDPKETDTPSSNSDPQFSNISESTLMTFQSGRPNLGILLSEAKTKQNGNTGVAVCGPLGLTAATRRQVAGMQSLNGREVYLHAETFGW